ncbi:MAG TPA: hypothetical protein VG710_08790 [Opitutus sp.]|nr:hypothetical protein [Opitutus sp.]
MGFDKDDPRPLINVNKRTTRVNLWMVVSVIVFFIVAGIVVWALWLHPAASMHEAVPHP